MTKHAAQETKVTVIIPNYNGGGYLAACLDSVLQSSIPVDILVVDDGSTDGSVGIAEGYAPRVRTICLSENTGFAHAVNTGIREASTPYVFLLNNDATVETETIFVLLQFLERRKDFFAAQALMLQADAADRVDSAGDYYNVLGHAFAAGKDRPRGEFTSGRRVTSACAGAALYRREVLLRLGAFDEAHFCYLEDVDLGIRAYLKGEKSACLPEAVVYHKGSATSGSRHNAFKVRLSAANNLYLLYKNFPPLMLLFNAPFLLAGILIKQLYFWRKGLGAVYVHGLLDGFHKIRDNKGKRVRFNAAFALCYVRFQLALWADTVRRITEG